MEGNLISKAAKAMDERCAGCQDRITMNHERLTKSLDAMHWKHEAERAHQEAAAERRRHLDTLKELEWYRDALAGLSKNAILALARKARQEQVAP